MIDAVKEADIIAYGCGHFIFKDNLPLALNAIEKAYDKANQGGMK